MSVLLIAFVVLNVAILVAVFAAIVRRLLGVRFGRVRLLLAGGLAFGVAGPISNSMFGEAGRWDRGLDQLWFFVLALAVSVLIAMVFLVLAEALVPTGSVQPLAWWRAWRHRMARSRRYLQITGIAIRHGLAPYLRGGRRGALDDAGGRSRLARSLRQALDEGGVTFVKLGQVLSTRRDLLPAEFVAELGGLQDDATPAPWAEVERLLADELGSTVDEVFAGFDRRPLASASVAQVYAARLRSGAEVVVKVQRPGIRPVVERDLDIVARLARSLHDGARWARSIGVQELAAGFAAALREELDFRVEAANMTAVAVAAAGRHRPGGVDPGRSETVVALPTPYEPLCTERVLVMHRLRGTPLRAAGPLIAEHGLDRLALGRALLDTVLRQIMLDGVFHADPHPGNVLVSPDGRLALLDFGSVGRLDPAVRSALQRLLLALDRGDPLGVSDALLEVLPRPDEIDEQGLERALGRFIARHLGPGSSPSLRMFTDLFRIVSEYGLSVPPEVAAVFRALATLEGTVGELAPDLDLVAEARAFATGYLAERATPASLRQAATDELIVLLPMLRRLPRRMERIAGAVEHGRLTLNVRLFADDRDRRHVTALLHQLLLTALAATAAIVAVLLLGTPGGPAITAHISLYQLLGYNLLVIGGVLALRVLILIFRADQ